MTVRVLRIPLPVKAVGEKFVLEGEGHLVFERAGISPEGGVPVVWCTAVDGPLPLYRRTLVVVRDDHVFPEHDALRSIKYISSWWEANVTFHLYEVA